MTPDNRRILLVAIAAGLLGVLASALMSRGGPLWRSPSGQWLLQRILARRAPENPAIAVGAWGRKLPTMELPLLDGPTQRLPDAYLGRPVLLNAWASWCAPCVEEMPELQRYATTQGDFGAQVVGIAMDNSDAVHRFVGQYQISYPILIDASGSLDTSRRLGNPSGVLPYTVMLDAQGHVCAQRIGPFRPGEITDWAASCFD